MYDPLKQHADADVHACFVREDMGLNKWFDDLPPFLKIDVSALPELAPPSHIVTLKYDPHHIWGQGVNHHSCLYHTFKILLHRPMLSRRFPRTGSASQPNPKHLIECVSSATSTIMIFDLFCRTFGESRCVLSISYAVYIAASIFLLHFQAAPDDKQTVRKLEFCINALERVQTVNPGKLHNIKYILARYN